jgi:YHS domain-containing protein
MAKVVDPVCGMEVDTDSAAATAAHEGKTYYFCSEGCRTRFMQNPDSYTGS